MNTNDPMTQERLDAIQERLDAATDGPWVEGQRCVFTEDYEHAIVSDSLVEAPGMTPYGEAVQNPADVALIANAPQDLTDLLAEVERLRAQRTVDDAKTERVARNLANLEVGEAWPTTRELGGVPRSGRDEEYRSAMREWAQKVINISLGEDEDEWI